MSINKTVVSRQSLVVGNEVTNDQRLPANAVVAGPKTNDIGSSAEEVLVSLKKKAALLETLRQDGVIKKKEISEVQKELAVAIKELEGLINA